jgi:tetratricopeptide (TPR) repeat protein
MEMYSSIAPARALKQVTSSDGISQETETAPLDQNVEEFWTPRNDWEWRDYRRAMFFAILRNNEEKMAQIDSAYRATDNGKIIKEIASWGAFCESMKIIHGTGNFSNLMTIVSQNMDNYDVLKSIARVYSHYKNYDKSAYYYNKAAEFAEEKTDKVGLLKEAALSYQSLGNSSGVLQMANEIRQNSVGDEAIEIDALNALQQIYDDAKMYTLRLCTLERISEIDPSNSESRFSLAYEHSQHGSEELSLYHYSLIGIRDRSATAWNNLGVAYSQFQLPVSAVRAFETSKSMNDTLAMSNLAHRYMNAGFLDEARKQCEQATIIPNYNTNINAALTRINELPTEEANSEREIIERARQKSQFLQNFGHALLGLITVPVSGHWRHPNSDKAMVTVDGARFGATVRYDEAPNALATVLAGLPSPRSIRVTLQYDGILHGRAIDCTITRDDGRPNTPMLLDLVSKTALMYLSEDNNQWHVMENPFGTHPTFHSLVRDNT